MDAPRPVTKRLSVEVIAERLGVAQKTLKAWVDAGLFPAPRVIGATEFYTEEDWEASVLLAGRWKPKKSRNISEEKGGGSEED